MHEPRTWDIFCRVVDNLGDAGVCWRLARQLAAEHGVAVRLWIDDLVSLRRLHPAVAQSERQVIDGVEICRWPAPFMTVTPAEVVVEAFGCGLPDEYLAAMVGAVPDPLWIVLEYLSAEPWVAAHHGLPSPHPRLPLARHYFFPGFVSGTGGLLREADLFTRRDRFDDTRRAAFWRSIGHEPPSADAIAVSIFAYGNAPLADLLRCWEHGDRDIVAAIPEGRLLASVARFFGADTFPAAQALRRGQLEVRAVPFVPQARYDELLWACDLNFVRGEDSFVRAQWAAPAFRLANLSAGGTSPLAQARGFSCALRGGDACRRPRRRVGTDAAVEPNRRRGSHTGLRVERLYVGAFDVLRQRGGAWAERIAAAGGLAGNLVRFCARKLKSG